MVALVQLTVTQEVHPKGLVRAGRLHLTKPIQQQTQLWDTVELLIIIILIIIVLIYIKCEEERNGEFVNWEEGS